MRVQAPVEGRAHPPDLAAPARAGDRAILEQATGARDLREVLG